VIPRFPVYIFDVDGTLLDSARDICGAIQQVIETTECRPVTFDYLKGYIGLHLDDLFQDLFPNCSPERSDSLLQQYRGIYRARGHSMTRVFPGVAEALAGLEGRKTTATPTRRGCP